MLTQTKAPDLTLVQSAPDPDSDRAPPLLSDILQDKADAPAARDVRISFGHLIEGCGNRTFGALLLIFAKVLQRVLPSIKRVERLGGLRLI